MGSEKQGTHPVFFEKRKFWLYYSYPTPENIRDTSSARNEILVENKQKNRISSVGMIYWRKS